MCNDINNHKFHFSFLDSKKSIIKAFNYLIHININRERIYRKTYQSILIPPLYNPFIALPLMSNNVYSNSIT